MLKRLRHRPRSFLLLAGLFLLPILLIVGHFLLDRPQLQSDRSAPATQVAPLDQPALVATPLPATKAPPPVSQTATPRLTATPRSTATPHSTATHPTATPHSTVTAQEHARNQQAIAAMQSSLALVDAVIEMHVAIAAGVPALTIATSAPTALLDQNGHSLHRLSAQTSYSIQAEGQTIRVGSWQVPSGVWLDVAPDQLFALGDRTYHGRLLLVAENGYLWAVNYIDMRQYLYSVVASEVSSSWEMEALKAQAVAARSYALVHYFRPATSLYHLGSTEQYQVYSGIEREADSTNQAVDATSGEFVSYQGGVVESLYAASDAIVASAFQGRGMSQLGALDLAKQGYTYRQILSNYYPDTGVTKIQLDQE
jgi:stage II sporulation protein D